jgi:hypothetical protein
MQDNQGHIFYLGSHWLFTAVWTHSLFTVAVSVEFLVEKIKWRCRRSFSYHSGIFHSNYCPKSSVAIDKYV